MNSMNPKTTVTSQSGRGLTPTANIAGNACHPVETGGGDSVQQPASRQPIGNVTRFDVTSTNTKRNTIVTVTVKRCEQCGAAYETKRPSQSRFCSSACRRGAWLACHPERATALAASDRARLRAYLEARGVAWVDKTEIEQLESDKP